MSLLPAKPGPRTDSSVGHGQWRFNYPGGVRANTPALDPISFLWDVTMGEIFEMWQLFGEDSVNSVDDQWVDGFLEESEKERLREGNLDEDDLGENEDEDGPDDPIDEDVMFDDEEEDEDEFEDNRATNRADIYERTVAGRRMEQAEDMDDIWETDAVSKLAGSYEEAEQFMPSDAWMQQFWDMPRAKNFTWTNIFVLTASAAAIIIATGYIRRKLRGDPPLNMDKGVDPEMGKTVLRKRRTPRGRRSPPAAAGTGLGSGVKNESATAPAYQATLRSARKAVSARRFLLAERALRRLLRRMEDDEATLTYRAPAFRMLATCLIGQEKWDEAIVAVNDFLRLVRQGGPTPPEAVLPDLVKLCVCESNLGNVDEADTLLKEIESVLPKATERQQEEMKLDLLSVSATIKSRAGQMAEAEAKSSQASTYATETFGELNPTTWRLRTDYALILLDCDKPEQAEPILDDVVANVTSFARSLRLPLLDRLSFVHRIATAESHRERFERADHFLQRAVWIFDAEPELVNTKLGKELYRMLWCDQACVAREKETLYTAAGNPEKANLCRLEALHLEGKVREGAEFDQTGGPLSYSRLLYTAEGFVNSADRCASLVIGLQSTRPRHRLPVYRIAAGSSVGVRILDNEGGKEVAAIPAYSLVASDFVAGKISLKSTPIIGVSNGQVLLALVSVINADGSVAGVHRQFMAVSPDSAQLRRAQAD